jgi:hypothetical protein
MRCGVSGVIIATDVAGSQFCVEGPGLPRPQRAGSLAPHRMTDSPARIGPYELVSRLGVGGMAETYVAVRRGPGGFEQRVCLKRVRRDLDGDPEFVRAFLAEAAIAAKLRHAAIAQVLDFGCERDDYYMALELIEGVDLRALLEHHPGGLPADVVLHVAVELATALDFAHRAGGDASREPVVHRDVSASNALLSVEGEVKLADFGIARPLSGPQHTQTGIVKGKVPYLAPEYARTGRFDARSDLFSLGVLLYEAACGARPHDGATDLETLERALNGTRTPLAQRAPALPGALCELVEQLLEADAELRVQSAAALLEGLLEMPASGRARRELGALVRAARSTAEPAGQALPQRTQAMDRAEAAPEPAGRTAPLAASSAGAASPATRSQRPLAPLRRGPGLALGVALAFALSVGALWIVRWTRAPRAPAPSAPNVASAVAPLPAAERAPSAADPPPIIEPPAATGSAADEAAAGADEAQAEARSSRAQLEVVVLPFGGEVFVDGKRAGTAPVTLPLTAGEHEVIARQRGVTLRRRVTLDAGERRQLVLR